MKTIKLKANERYKDLTRQPSNFYLFYEGKIKGKGDQQFRRGIVFRKYFIDKGKYDYVGRIIVPITEINQRIKQV